jgi:amino acid transporter
VSKSHNRGLRRECLSFFDVLAQSVANVAPVATPALIVPLVFASGQNGTWFAYLLATSAMLLMTYHINQFASRSASPGALYTFTLRGLGPMWGVISGWSLVLAYLFTGASVLAGAANYVVLLARPAFGHGFDFIVALLAIVAMGGTSWWIAYRDIQLSTRTMLTSEFISVTLILIVAVVFLFKTGHVVDHWQLELVHGTPGGIRLGMVLAIFSFVGFESATALGHEAKNPLRTIPRSVLFSVLITGVFFIFTAYVLVMAFRWQKTSLAETDAPLSVLGALAGVPSFGIAIAIGAAVSETACALASINAAARVLYTMSSHGLIHSAAGRTHETHSTPHVAIVVTSSLATLLPVVLLLRHVAPLDIFGYLGSLATYGFLFAYALTAIASPIYLWRRRESWRTAAAISVAALGLLSLPIIASFYPVPPAPAKYLPYIFASLLAVGIVRFGYLSVWHPNVILELEKSLLAEADTEDQLEGQPLVERGGGC